MSNSSKVCLGLLWIDATRSNKDVSLPLANVLQAFNVRLNFGNCCLASFLTPLGSTTGSLVVLVLAPGVVQPLGVLVLLLVVVDEGDPKAVGRVGHEEDEADGEQQVQRQSGHVCGLRFKERLEQNWQPAALFIDLVSWHYFGSLLYLVS